MPCPQQFRISPTNRNHHEDSDFNHQKQWFDAILSGEKTVETREVRPTNTKYISYRDNNTGRMYKRIRMYRIGMGQRQRASIRLSTVTMLSGSGSVMHRTVPVHSSR